MPNSTNKPARQRKPEPPDRGRDAPNPFVVLRANLEANREIYSSLLGVKSNSDEMERFIVQCYQHVWHHPDLLDANRDSLLLAFAEAAVVGVSLNPTAKEGYIEVRKGTASFRTQYQGLIKLLYRAHDIDFIHADVVRKGDRFVVHGGSNPRIEHTACPLGEEPEGYDSDEAILATYAVVQMRGASHTLHEVSRRADFMKARSMSKGPAWKQWMSQMAKKVPLRRLANRIPGADDARAILSVEDSAEDGKKVTLEQVAQAFGQFQGQPSYTPSLEPKPGDLDALMEASGPAGGEGQE